MHHKRGRRKDRRAGCLMCKPHKSTALKDTKAAQTVQERRSNYVLLDAYDAWIYDTYDGDSDVEPEYAITRWLPARKETEHGLESA